MLQVEQEPRELAKIWFGMLGGASAWVLHLMGSYAIGEFGCAGVLHGVRWLGINATCWVLILFSLVLAGVAAAASWAGRQTDHDAERQAPATEDGETDERRPVLFAGHAGMLMSGWALFIILVESIPTFFFLQGC